MKITDEMVEAGLKSLDVPHWLDMTMEDDVRAVLEAAAPLVAAKALRDASDEVRNYAYQPDDVSGPFPSEQQPAYLTGATDAHHVVDRLLRARADRIARGEP